jgi:hypothetical protein
MGIDLQQFGRDVCFDESLAKSSFKRKLAEKV